MGRESALFEKKELFVSLLALQLCHAGLHIVSRVAVNIGVSKLVYTLYRNIIALLLIGPWFFFGEKERPPLTFSLLFHFFLLALFGITAKQGFNLLGLYYTSPTFASAIKNSVPVITFVMDLFCRSEKGNFSWRYWLARVVGIIASVGGATIITLYKGPLLHQLHHSLGSSVEEDMFFSSKKTQNWRRGCICLLLHCLLSSGWKLLQKEMIPWDSEDQEDPMEEQAHHVLKKYPAKLTLTYTRFFGVIQFLGLTAFVEGDLKRWEIQSRAELFTILYAGIVVSGIAFYLHARCIHKGGPVLVAVFEPVRRILVVIMAYLLLGDPLYSGGIIGAILIMLGLCSFLCSVLWGESEKKPPNGELTEPLTTKETEESRNEYE